MTAKCPYCGRQVRLVTTVPATTSTTAWNITRLTGMGDVAQSPFGEAATEPAIPAMQIASRTTPARAATVESDVVVPLLTAVVSGVIIIIVLAVLAACIALKWPLWMVLAWAGVICFAIIWFALVVDTRNLLRIVEKAVDRDIDGDGHKGEPRPQIHRVEGVVKREDRGPDNWDLFKLPAPTAGHLQMFAKDVLSGKVSFSERGAADYGYGRELWQELRDEHFVRRDWALWRHDTNEKLGVRLTSAGRQILQIIAEADLQ